MFQTLRIGDLRCCYDEKESRRIHTIEFENNELSRDCEKICE